MRLAIVLSFLLLAGCNTNPIVVDTKAVDKAPITLPSVDEYVARDVEWVVITPDNVEEVFKKLAKKGNSIAVFALSSDGYEALSLNASDIRKLIQQLNAQINAYKQYYIKVTPKTPASK